MPLDLRKTPGLRGRSINLALSERGLTALKSVGLDQEIKSELIPMTGRMLHVNVNDSTGRPVDVKQRFVPYGAYGEAINSVDRKLLNEVLLTAAEKIPGVSVHFEHDLIKADLDAGQLTFLNKFVH
jgi:kynurenine 3-monooxygenase